MSDLGGPHGFAEATGWRLQRASAPAQRCNQPNRVSSSCLSSRSGSLRGAPWL